MDLWLNPPSPPRRDAFTIRRLVECSGMASGRQSRPLWKGNTIFHGAFFMEAHEIGHEIAGIELARMGRGRQADLHLDAHSELGP